MLRGRGTRTRCSSIIRKKKNARLSGFYFNFLNLTLENLSPPTNVNLPPPTSEEPSLLQINEDEDEAQQSDEQAEPELIQIDEVEAQQPAKQQKGPPVIQIDEVEEQEQPAEQQKESEPPIEIDDLFETSDEQQVKRKY